MGNLQQALSKLSKETERQNRLERRQRDLEAENRALRKQLAQKDEVIDILKKSVGILSKP